jgi:UDP-glucose 4-epimerase
MSKVLVTGAAGFIGSHVADYILRNGHESTIIDDLSGGFKENVPKQSDFAMGNVCDPLFVGKVFSKYRPDFVIHCAAFAAENLSHNCRVFTIQNNLVGEGVIRNACINHDVKCMVSLSSIAVMGHEAPPFDDNTQPHPKDVYGVMKYAGELDAAAAHDFHGLNYCVVRPHNVVGIRQNYSDKFRNVAAIFIRQALEGKPLTIFGDGSQTRAFSPVSYVSQIIAEIVDKPEVWNQTFNVGSDNVMTVIALAKLICKIVGVKENFNFLPARKEASHAHMIHTTCQKHFAHVPEPDLEDVLSAMIVEACAKGFLPMQEGPYIEVKKGLIESWKK